MDKRAALFCLLIPLSLIAGEDQIDVNTLLDAEALVEIREELNPGGSLLVQMQAGLPQSMKQALEEIIGEDFWKEYFSSFESTWHSNTAEEYCSLISQSSFIVHRCELIQEELHFATREEFEESLKSWFPYLAPLPEDMHELFLTELIDRYLEIEPATSSGGVRFISEQLEIEANKDAPCNLL